ncbi:MAG: rhomboid family intramembrane serine protease [Planctomycetota bacterium]
MLLPLFDRQPTTRPPLLTVLLMVVNVGAFWWLSNLSEEGTLDTVVEYGFVPQRFTEVDSGEPLPIEVPLQENRVYRTQLSTDGVPVYRTLLTMMFLHGSWLHVISNMWMLWIFGNNVEDRLGHFVFLVFYLLGGTLSAVCQWVVDPLSTTPVIGASGAVWAVLGAYAITYPKAKIFTLLFIGIPIPVNLPALLVIAVKFALDLALGVWMLQGMGGQPIAYWAHVGGCVAGVLLMPLLSLGAAPAGSNWQAEVDEALPMSPDRFDTARLGVEK